MPRDGYTQIATLLRADEAELLQGVLASAGIEAIVEGEQVAALALPIPMAGASLLVKEADAERAHEVVAGTGVSSSEPDAEVAGIDEAEWRAVPEGEAVPEAPRSPAEDAESLSRSALGWALVSVVLCFTLLVPVYALEVASRARGAPRAARSARVRAVVASVLATLSLLGGAYLLLEVAPELAARKPVRTIDIGGGRSIPVPYEPPRPPRAPFP